MKAIVSLLDDEDREVREHVEQKIYSLGSAIIPFLEEQWQSYQFNPETQKRIEEIVHQLQFNQVMVNLIEWKQDGGTDLLRGMWIVATYQYPDLSLADLSAKMQQLFFDAWLDFKPDLRPFDQIRILNDVFFNKMKFKANTTSFHSVSNSMVNTLLESRKGNPIGMCAVYMLIAQKLNLPVSGVNLPNLFILTYKSGDLQFYINVFNRGLIFSRKDIDNYLQQLNLGPNPTFYEPCTHIDIVKRMLRNLILSYEKINEPVKVEEVNVLLKAIADEGDETP
jgi:regulator of sirC expression with transglutaminase-like and TPR domain